MVLTCFALVGAIKAQTIGQLSPKVFASAGQVTTTGNLNLSYTIGEPIVETLVDIKLILTEGFHQPEDDFVPNAVQEFPTAWGNIKVFPNPFNENLTIEVETDKQHDLYLYIYDVLGQQVESTFLANHYPGKNQYSISTAGLAQGMYTLTIATESGDFLKTVKVNKIQ